MKTSISVPNPRSECVFFLKVKIRYRHMGVLILISFRMSRLDKYSAESEEEVESVNCNTHLL
jgi:hypothetical protein